MTDEAFKAFAAILAQQDPFFPRIREALSIVVQRTKEGFLDHERYQVESTEDEEILACPKGSPKQLELARAVTLN